MAHPDEGPAGHVLGSSHGTSLLAAIVTLGGRSIGVEGDQGVGGQLCRRDVDMESTGEVCRDLCVGLKMGGQRGQRRLGVSTTATAAVDVRRHGGR